jgi:hypothetical protein
LIVRLLGILRGRRYVAVDKGLKAREKLEVTIGLPQEAQVNEQVKRKVSEWNVSQVAGALSLRNGK